MGVSTANKPAKGKAGAKAKAKPCKASADGAKKVRVRKTKAETASSSKGLKFRARGPHKCVVSAEGQSLRGVHKALARTIAQGFDYDRAKARGTLKEVKRDPTEHCVAIPECITKKRRMAYSKQEGIKLDAQVGRVAKLCFPQLLKAQAIALPLPPPAVPLLVLVDPAVRKRYFATGCAGPRHPSEALLPYTPPSAALKTRITNAVKPLMPETLQVLHEVAKGGWHIAGTQVPVAKGNVGTCLDLLLVRPSPPGSGAPGPLQFRVIELKNGCVENWTSAGCRLGPPFVVRGSEGHLTSPRFTTHREYQAQLLLNHRLFRHTFPQRAAHTLPPQLWRVDRQGLWIDHVPAWMQAQEEGLALRCGC